MAATTKNWETYWDHWGTFVQPLGVDPHLQGVGYQHRIRLLTGFAAAVRAGDFGRGRRVQTSTVSSALAALGQAFTVASGENPLKIAGSDKLVPRIQQMCDGWRLEDPQTRKMLPVEADVPEFLAEWGCSRTGTTLDRAIGDMALVAFYYLLRVGEYTTKANPNETKRKVQFKFEDVTFF